MKLRLLILFMLLPLMALQTNAESRLETIQKSGKLRIGVTGDFNPMNFKNPASNSYEGFDIDMALELAKDMKVEVEFVQTDWKTLISGILADKYDISCSASLNPARALVAGYTDSYAAVSTVPLTLKKHLTRFQDWSDINQSGVKVATTLGTVFEDEAKRYFPKAKLVSIEPPGRDYQVVISGRAEVSITSNMEASTLIKKYDNLVIVPTEGRSRKPLAMLVDKSDQEWINFLNHWITFKESQGFLPELRKKWFGGGQ